MQETSGITEALYRNKENLETIFRAMDKDNSGTDLLNLIYGNPEDISCLPTLCSHMRRLFSNRRWLISHSVLLIICRLPSGYISLPEFEDACQLLSQHTNSTLSQEDVRAMAKNMDMNKDGYIDFNEFLEAFRIVDQFGKELNRRYSDDGDLDENAEKRSRYLSGSTDETFVDDGAVWLTGWAGPHVIDRVGGAACDWQGGRGEGYLIDKN